MTEKSYKERMERAKTQNHLKLVVSQPTKPSAIRARMDETSPTKISQDRAQKPTDGR
jgi:hypothetical protein